MLIKIKLLDFLYLFRSISSNYILNSIIINLGKIEDLIINIYTYKDPLIILLYYLFIDSK